ncbi:MAG: PH domain-containing protein [Weeksellaceae bacterium]|nr:PH domain-containing protein [Weeksellaceae bacterium]
MYETDISKITKIRKGETMWSGFHKYGTATKGLIVFARYKDDLYISPENEELFYQKILEINPEVVIENV